ncbi:hypothetical protein [Persicitalea sp.]|uniref:hypothetical protein n=1 Tax=Persicitalea sp. TaxID=3100273 RepID=UPI0035935DF9
MNDSAAFYQTFYQNEALFRVAEPVLVEIEEEKKLIVEEENQIPLEKEQTQVDQAAVPGTKEDENGSLAPVTTGKETPSSQKIPPPAAPFLTLQHRVLVLVDEKSQQDLLPADALLLGNILKATGHDPAEMDILNFSYLPQADARTVLAQKSTNYFISFGVPLIKLKLDLLLPPYTPKKVEGIWFLLAEPLSVIDADKTRKKRLWLALKQMFAVA